MSVHQILADLDRHKQALDLSNGLGQTLLDTSLAGQLDRFDNQVDPDGRKWPELEERYEARKSATHPGAPIGVRDGLLRSDDEQAGEVTITPESAKRTYGVSQDARDEAEWFSEGDPAQNRPPRPFVGLSEDDQIKSDDVINQYLRDNL